jgi:hypothetical protein
MVQPFKTHIVAHLTNKKLIMMRKAVEGEKSCGEGKMI